MTMRAVRAVTMVAVALVLGPVAVATAQLDVPAPGDQSGIVARVDPPGRVVILEDGRMYRVGPPTILVAGGRSVPLTQLQPGQSVLIKSGERVVVRDGQYVTVVEEPRAAAPSAAVAAAPPGVRHRVAGQVTDVDRDGDVRIRTSAGSFEVRLSPAQAAGVRAGDPVTIEVVIPPVSR